MNTQPIVRPLPGYFVAVALLCVVCVSAFAAEPQAPSVVVRYADLNLSNPSGIDKLYQRIRTAAQLVCGETGVRSLQARAAALQCQEHAIDDAVKTVNNRILTAMHKEKASTRRLS